MDLLQTLRRRPLPRSPLVPTSGRAEIRRAVHNTHTYPSVVAQELTTQAESVELRGSEPQRLAQCPHCGHRIPLRAGAEPKKKWKRILYERQDYEDNYVDESFLQYVQQTGKNRSQGGDVRGRYSQFWSIVLKTAGITQHLCVTVVFFSVFYLLFCGILSDAGLIVVDVVVFITGASLALFSAVVRSVKLSHLSSGSDRLGSEFQEAIPSHIDSGAKSDWQGVSMSVFVSFVMKHRANTQAMISRGILFVTALLGLSPVLKTLTLAYASDTIYALTIFLSGLQVLLQDYRTLMDVTPIPMSAASARPQPVAPLVTSTQGSLSLNASIFAAILMASRLGSELAVFAVLLFAFEIFAGFPLLSISVKAYSIRAHVLLTLLLVVASVVLLSFVSQVLVAVHTGTIIFVTLVCPYWLKAVQRYKNAIAGPWDYDDESEGLG